MNSNIDIHSMRILIIDNSENSSGLIKAILKKETFQHVFTATSIKTAIEMLKDERPDLILLSYVLPEISGTEACKLLSSDIHYEDIPIIMVTANNDIQTLQRSFENGAIDYIAKPFNGHELVARVQAHLIRKHVADERKKKAITDPLTNIYNRRHFDTIFEHFYLRASSEEKSLTFFMIDIDNFKKYNDNYGHHKGDEALQAVARTLQTQLHRTEDYLFRLGGEEFSILLYDTSDDFIKTLSSNIHQALTDLNIEHAYNEGYERLTLSIGVATCGCKKEMTKFDIYNSADQALYRSKENGRNRSTFFKV